MNRIINKKDVGELFEVLLPKEAQKQQTLPGVDEVLNWKETNDRRIVINEIVTEELLFYNQLIIQWNKEDFENNLKVSQRKPIRIYLNTYGGNVDPAMSLSNLIQISKTPVYIYNLGVCASAGVLIFLSGHKRYALKGSKFLIHEGEIGLSGQSTKVMENLEAIKQQEKEIENYIISKTNIDKKLYNKNRKKEWWISSEAKDLGIVDDIIEDIEETFK